MEEIKQVPSWVEEAKDALTKISVMEFNSPRSMMACAAFEVALIIGKNVEGFDPSKSLNFWSELDYSERGEMTKYLAYRRGDLCANAIKKEATNKTNKKSLKNADNWPEIHVDVRSRMLIGETAESVASFYGTSTTSIRRFAPLAKLRTGVIQGYINGKDFDEIADEMQVTAESVRRFLMPQGSSMQKLV